ncbi:MAG: hypothetical protein ACPGU1_05950 [Myxococcota bacterium]
MRSSVIRVMLIACVALATIHCGGDTPPPEPADTASSPADDVQTEPAPPEDTSTPSDSVTPLDDATTSPEDTEPPPSDVVEATEDTPGPTDTSETEDIAPTDVEIVPPDVPTTDVEDESDADAAPEVPECVEASDCIEALASASPCDVVLCEGGNCAVSAAADGTSCDDADACSVDDQCTAGTCAGVPLDCATLNSACTTGSCDADTGSCVALAMDDGTACDDANSCSENDSCQAGVCAGTPMDCSSAVTACTDAVCDLETGSCVPVWKAEGTACDDGDLCTDGDACTGGACVASPVVCEPQDDGPCQVRTCDGETGACVPVAEEDGAECDDGAACTYGDTCSGGSCSGTLIDCGFLDEGCRVGACQEPLGNCLQLDADPGTVCDDGDSCTGDDQCNAGECEGSPLDCSALDAPCFVGQCSPITGECNAVPQLSLTACDDGDPCTTQDICLQGTCQGTTLDCALPDAPCQDGACDPETGSCVTSFAPEGESCDDGLLCTEGDHCEAGDCVGDGPDCSDLDDGCMMGVCDDDTGGCKQVPVMDGNACDDGLFCTVEDTCSAGVCGGAPRVCEDAGPCDLGVCDDTTDSCGTAISMDGVPCEDGDPCTEDDACLAGYCIAVPRDCTHLDQACAVGTCDSEVGECIAETVGDGTLCSDDDPCTIADTCSNGTCSGSALDCSSLEGPCNTAACDSGTGACVKTAKNEFMACDDTSKCTYNDRCTAGVCQGTPYDCSSLETPCRSATCDPDTGACATTNLPDESLCDDDDACTTAGTCNSGYCQTATISCDGFGDICNIGKCDSDTGQCYSDPKPDGAGCGTNNPCIFGTTCQGGVCSGTEKDCSDFGGPCSDGYCNPANGFCTSQLFEDGTSCDDGQSCTGPDACLSGNCTGTFDLATPGCDHPCATPIIVDQDISQPGVQLPFLYSDTTAGGTDDVDTQGCASDIVYGQGSPDLIFQFDVPADGTYQFRLADTSFYGDDSLNGVLSIHYGACPSMPGAFCDALVTVEGDTGSDALSRVLSEGSVVYLVVDGATAEDAGIFSLRVEGVPTSETACDDNFDDENDGLTDCDDPDCDDDFQCLPPIPDGALAFTEVMMHPASPLSSPQAEWLEVRNVTDSNIALANLWLTMRSWSVDDTEPPSPTSLHMLTQGTAYTQQYTLLSRAPAGADNGTVETSALYTLEALSHTDNIRLQIIRPGWNGIGDPPANYIIDDVTFPPNPESVAGRSWQLSIQATSSEPGALNDVPSNWCQTPAYTELSYTAGNYGTPVGGGEGGTSGTLNGNNISCD